MEELSLRCLQLCETCRIAFPSTNELKTRYELVAILADGQSD